MSKEVICLSSYYKKHKKKIYGLYECFCGQVFTCIHSRIKNKIQKSCGCSRYKHKLAKSSEYRIWIDIKRRCLDQRTKGYKNYGAKGVTICKEWTDNFESFYKDMGARPSNRHSIDRIDNSKGYSKDNCKWSTSEEQNNNRGSYNKLLTFNGETKTQAQWAKLLNIKDSTINKRLSKYKWSIQKTLSTKVKGTK